MICNVMRCGPEAAIDHRPDCFKVDWLQKSPKGPNAAFRLQGSKIRTVQIVQNSIFKRSRQILRTRYLKWQRSTRDRVAPCSKDVSSSPTSGSQLGAPFFGRSTNRDECLVFYILLDILHHRCLSNVLRKSSAKREG